ncbi:hypothetical protein [Paenibacillus beijingensis]|uniref:Uncharacterized protein n=1 Tax=Paenibacillus beijingensis TaxID=1126833 RepID=A0A0D5NNN1_9BACL|nr:hypothetical protein [Paenibacillus beijingensis]AJY76886.1 hypothetical protein VN24_22890 [Paenibacillus beijingensis]
MNKELQFLSFWAVNAELNVMQLQSQLDEIRAAGFSGVVFHPRYYPNDPPYMSGAYLNVVSELILYAKAASMSFWIYDENGWPSGIAGGEVMRRRPTCQCEWIEWKENDAGGSLSFGSKAAVSSFDFEATELFIQITYEGYRTGLSPEAFAYVEGFFSDEVAFLDGHGLTLKTGALPWDPRLDARYREQYGEEIFPSLPLLFTGGEGDRRFRIRYWEMLTDLLAEGFYKPVADWCAKHGKKYTAHLKAEEHPYFQLSYSGSCFELLKLVETPAIDALERYPGNHFYPKIAHSIAVQQGRDFALAEAMGGGGWGVSPELFADYILWLAGHGIRCFVIHLNQFRLTTQAIRDWPPSMPSHLTWKDAFPALLAAIQRDAAFLPDLTGTPELLIVTPTRGIMASFLPQEAMVMNEHDGSNAPESEAAFYSQQVVRLAEACHEAGIHVELTEERTLERDGRIVDGKLHIGRREYSRVLIAEGCLWEKEDTVQKMRDAGIAVLQPDNWRTAFPESAPADRTAGTVTISPEQSRWSVQALPVNQAYVEWEQSGNGNLNACFPLEQTGSIEGPLEVFLHDPVMSLKANGAPLTLHPAQGGFAATLGEGWNENFACEERMALYLEAVPVPGGEPCPAAFIRGRFALLSQSSWMGKDERQLTTAGPFVLAPLEVIPQAADFIVSGFPFCGSPVKMMKAVNLPEIKGGASLRFTGIRADAAFVTIGQRDLGWCWGPDWTVPCPSDISAGMLDLELTLYPSTFNVYGPHRHIDGDRYLTSPDQYNGIKNFADRPDAPDCTRGTQWHFVKWGITGDIQLVFLDEAYSGKGGG